MTARILRPASALATLLFALGLALAFSLSATAHAQEEGDERGLPLPGQDEEPGEDDGTTDDGFEDGTTEGFGADEEPQVDAPAGGAEAGFGGTAGEDGLLMVVFLGSLALIAAVAGGVWYRKAFTSSR